MTDKRFNNNEIQLMFTSIDTKLDGIIYQTTLTNGKVKKLREDVDALNLWKAYVLGGVAVASFLFGIALPFMITLIP